MIWLISILGAFVSNVTPADPGDEFPLGGAKGSLTYEGETVALTFAGAFVDREEDRKPVILVIADQKLPLDKWNSEIDMMHDQTKWSGLVFFLDRDNNFYRSDVHMKGRQASVSGLFELKLDEGSGPDLSGMARTPVSEKDTQLDVSFRAARPR